MRNWRVNWRRERFSFSDGRVILVALCLAVCLAGCAADKETHDNLAAGFASLQGPHDDELSDAISRSDAQLTRQPQGAGAAEALYLRGRALEQRVKKTPAAASADLSQARQAYTDALNQSPSAQLEPYIRTSLANVCYWQDDYATALQEWSMTFGKLTDENVNAFVLYRIGLCQQRLGDFAAADQSFAKVAQRYPNTEPADRAKTHENFKYFVVQLATFASPQSAAAAMTQLVRQSVNPKNALDPLGRHVVTIGPAATYAQAQQLRARFVAQYPEAIIVP